MGRTVYEQCAHGSFTEHHWCPAASLARGSHAWPQNPDQKRRVLETQATLDLPCYLSYVPRLSCAVGCHHIEFSDRHELLSCPSPPSHRPYGPYGGILLPVFGVPVLPSFGLQPNRTFSVYGCVEGASLACKPDRPTLTEPQYLENNESLVELFRKLKMGTD